MKTLLKRYELQIIICVAVILFLCAASALFGQSTATLTVTAQGTPPFAYQWIKDGAPIAGATMNPLVLSPLKSTDTGAYAVSVANSAGSTASSPLNLVVTAATSTTPPVDLSKQYAELALTTAYTPPVAQFPDFAIVPLKRVNDPGSHFDDATGMYLIAAGEAGVYEILITARTVDQPPANVGVGLTAGIDNKDNKTLWQMTPPNSGAYTHWGMQAIVRGSYASGDKIRVNVFTQSSLTFVSFNVTVRRLY